MQAPDPNAVAQLVSNPALTAAVVQLASMATHGFTGMMSAHGLEVVKSLPWIGPKWSKMSRWAKVVWGGVLALGMSLGVTGAFHYDPAVQGGFLTITLAGIGRASVGSHIWGLMQSWSSQQFTYNLALQPKVVAGSAPVAGVAPPVPVPVAVVPPAPAAAGS